MFDWAQIRSAFPDGHFAINDQFSEGDKVVTRWAFRGTHCVAVSLSQV